MAIEGKKSAVEFQKFFNIFSATKCGYAVNWNCKGRNSNEMKKKTLQLTAFNKRK